MKKPLALILIVVMVFAYGSIAPAQEEMTAYIPEVNQFPMDMELAASAASVITRLHDRTGIFGAENDVYFTGTAKEDIEQLLNEGRVSINGFALPAAEEDTEAFQVNMVDSLVKIEDSWGSGLHKSVPEAGMTFEEARHSLVESVSRLPGGHTTFYLDDKGICILIDISSCDGVSVVEISENNGIYQIDPGDFTLESTRDRVDPRDILFDADKFDQDISVGDLAYYWYDPEGWHIEGCEKISGVLTTSDGDKFHETNLLIDAEAAPSGSGVERYYINSVNRPTQFYQSYENLGLSCPATIWLDEGGFLLGMTYGESAREVLADCISKVEEILASVTASDNGDGLEPGTLWVKSSTVGKLEAALDNAKEIYDTEGNYETAIGKLGQTLGCGIEGRASGFMGSIKVAE